MALHQEALAAAIRAFNAVAKIEYSMWEPIDEAIAAAIEAYEAARNGEHLKARYPLRTLQYPHGVVLEEWFDSPDAVRRRMRGIT